MSKVLEFTDENFDIELENTNNPVIVDFLRHGADTAAHKGRLLKNSQMSWTARLLWQSLMLMKTEKKPQNIL